jgi:hypothetical protein
MSSEDGPWGKQYKVKQTDVIYWPVDSKFEYIIILWRNDDSLPIAADIDTDYIYDGMEVQIATK